MKTLSLRRDQVLADPPFAQHLFGNRFFGWLWLLPRLWLGYTWLDAALHKISDPAWTQTGETILGFWTRAVAIPESGRPAISFDWYRGFIQLLIDNNAQTWFGPLVAYGEFLIGLALILGAFTGIAAFAGAFMNWNFLMAGTASTNGLLLVVAILLVLAWKVAGTIGADYFLLRWLGTPWGKSPTAEPAAKR
ncbi:MAG TPA: DoxX family protein [Anaerolineales bacterium]|nr:DoxX family protein [Anaerolineales bacterium]